MKAGDILRPMTRTDDQPVTTPARDRFSSPTLRREMIRERVSQAGFVRVDELADAFGVSLMTVHRDLDVLSDHGHLRKVRGGATTRSSATYHGDLQHRLNSNNEAKRALAREAARELQSGQIVFIDESTTCLHLVDFLIDLSPITVVTNFLTLIARLRAADEVSMIGLGGTYFPAYDAFLGASTAAAAAQLSADLAILSTTAITNGVCYHQSEETVVVKQALMQSAGRTILVADHTKFIRRGAHPLAPVTEFDRVIVDAETPAEIIASLRSGGVRVAVAGSG